MHLGFSGAFGEDRARLILTIGILVRREKDCITIDAIGTMGVLNAPTATPLRCRMSGCLCMSLAHERFLKTAGCSGIRYDERPAVSGQRKESMSEEQFKDIEVNTDPAPVDRVVMRHGGVFCCQHKDRCGWQGFVLHQGLGWGTIPHELNPWRQAHDQMCGGSLIQLVQPYTDKVHSQFVCFSENGYLPRKYCKAERGSYDVFVWSEGCWRFLDNVSEATAAQWYGNDWETYVR